MDIELARHAALQELHPTHNLYQQFGPWCPVCSGLGQILVANPSTTVRFASRCTCGGTGVDREAVRAREMQSLIERIMDLEAKNLTLLDRLAVDSRYKLNGVNSRQMWSELIAWATADGTQVTTTTTETIALPAVTLPANYMQDGRKLRLRAFGKYSTKASGTVSLQFFLRWGAAVSGTLLSKTDAMTALVSMTNAAWECMTELQVRSNGATGTIMANGIAHVFGATAPTIGSATGAPATAPMTVGGQTGPAASGSAALNADTALSLSIAMGASDAANTFTGLDYTLEALN